MKDTTIYEVLIKQAGEIYRYLFEYDITEFWAEPDTKTKLYEAFREKAYLEEYEILEIKPSDFIDLIK